MLLGGKAQARLHQKLDANKMKTIELIALMDRSFNQRRLIEGKSTANVLTGAIVKIQREALDLTMKAISSRPKKNGEAVEKDEPQEADRPRVARKQAANA